MIYLTNNRLTSMKTKPVGLRLPMDLWDRVEIYGKDNYPKVVTVEGVEKESFDITVTLNELLNRGLGTSGDVKQLLNSDDVAILKSEIDRLSDEVAEIKKPLAVAV